ncbi:TPA-induced transmembrane protein homolog [Micropterus salmoides]|uniref:TPA-induced transmembrane protein homolog n=1 Tax=Micropterus salmoides TaxID=27706 RepID=UPI0018ECB0D2|nr:TPA-induced transmembrane protein homolog [Micropterus salmoides]XP_038548780.1 TPA-induced transmembrane protein homolog [Micropterus salmoides]
MDFELQTILTNGNDGTARERVTAGNGDGEAYRVPENTETDGLLSVQTTGCNGETIPSGHAAEPQWNHGNTQTPSESCMCRIKRKLNEVAFWKVRLWMIIIFIFLLIIAAIIISLVMCSVIHGDADEDFDASLFKVPRYFNGSFQLPNMVFTEELFTPFSKGSQQLTADLQEKLAGFYRSSPALGRYFSEAEIYGFRSGSVIADYQLTFLMPEEQQDQLRNFTLSREMVYNVFRQFLYDQQPDDSGQMYIDPVSLKMFLRH